MKIKKYEYKQLFESITKVDTTGKSDEELKEILLDKIAFSICKPFEEFNTLGLEYTLLRIISRKIETAKSIDWFCSSMFFSFLFYTLIYNFTTVHWWITVLNGLFCGALALKVNSKNIIKWSKQIIKYAKRKF